VDVSRYRQGFPRLFFVDQSWIGELDVLAADREAGMPRGVYVVHPVVPGAVDQDEQIAAVDRMRVSGMR
jgi:hypothetical protein